MDGEYIRDDSQILEIETSSNFRPGLKVKSYFRKEAIVKKCGLAAQVLHFLVSAGYLWAGIVEFIRNPPFFDAYGDAGTSIDVPRGYVKNDPWTTNSGLLRLIDLPILSMLIGYKAVCIWLRYKGLSWLVTFCFTITLLVFWIVNSWASKTFEWRKYSKRMNGLQLQVSSIALSATMMFMVIFYKRKKWPFKFKSSLSMNHNSALHVIWNLIAIYLVMFASLMIWFIKLYASWACFDSVKEIMELCSATTQVQCYACSKCYGSALRECIKEDKQEFTCSTRYTAQMSKGAFCVFNFNMSIYGFLLTFAYIGGLCVFLSTFLRIIGHYALRGFFLAYEKVLRLHNRGDGKSTTPGSNFRRRKRRRDTELSNPAADGNDTLTAEGNIEYSSESDEDGNILINATYG